MLNSDKTVGILLAAALLVSLSLVVSNAQMLPQPEGVNQEIMPATDESAASVLQGTDIVTRSVSPMPSPGQSSDEPDTNNDEAITGSLKPPDPLLATGTLEGVVEQDGTGTPIIGAEVTAKTNPTYVTYSLAPNGGYRFEGIPSGSYTVTAEAYTYHSQTITDVTVVAGGKTSQDFQLSPGHMYVLSGAVTDANTGWPLYASLDIDGYPGDAIWNDPATGVYSVTLAAEISYTLQVNAWTDGYHAASREVGPLTQNQTEDFGLEVDTTACVAPGYQRPGVYELFENDGLPPAGWTIVDNVGNGQIWLFDNPKDRENKTGGTGDFAIVDSDHYGGQGQQDTELRTPSMDLSVLASVDLVFDTDYWSVTTADVADVDVSTDGGENWTNVWQKTGGSYRGPHHEVVDLSGLVAGQSTVIVRFHYYNASFEWWWQLDNVSVGNHLGCYPRSGGLVLGNVYDGNTAEPLIGAEITSDSEESATTLATQNDPEMDDGFYVLFSPAGSHTFTATMSSGYGSDIETISVFEGDAVRQDFHLPMGRLSYEPDNMDITLEMGQSTIVPLKMSNQGSQALDFEITELDMGFEPSDSALMHNVTPNQLNDDVDWLSAKPPSGTIEVASQQVVSVTFDAAGPSVTQPGMYRAELQMQNNTIYGNPTVPVTMTIVAPSVYTYLPILIKNIQPLATE